MEHTRLQTYTALNALAEPGGIVIFGGTKALQLPLGELTQAFCPDAPCYNRSFKDLSVSDASLLYEQCIAPLCPQTVLLQIGEADLACFDPWEFSHRYRQLIRQIRNTDSRCRIGIVSLPDSEQAKEVNKLLQYLACSEGCDFCDLSAFGPWAPQQLHSAANFVCDTGFVRPLRRLRPLSGLAYMLMGPLAG